MKRIALIGEGMIELSGAPFGPLQQTYGGDTINTAVYLARLASGSFAVHYASALGTDSLSDLVLLKWQAEGVDTECVLRDSTRTPGLYWIQIDERGERSFLYWRSHSAARYLLQHVDYGMVQRSLGCCHAIYLSGISLAILPPHDRGRLIEQLVDLASRGVQILFDTNYRDALWSIKEALGAIAQLLPAVRIMLTSFEDEQCLTGDKTVTAIARRLHGHGVTRVVVRAGVEGCWLCEQESGGDRVVHIPTQAAYSVVDTTAAGDSFNAAFIAAWLNDQPLVQCCRAGNALAGTVIQYRGAIIPGAATPSLAALLER